ncbi:MAG: hypothetical protein IPN71_14830 [Fibrobacteres bacterium]|nr:hypothetical protein [Fibrobacterota bacterium]
MNKKYSSPNDRLNAAKSESTELSELAALAESEYEFVKLAVASNKVTSNEILQKLAPETIASKHDYAIAKALIEHANLSIETRDRLEKLTEKKPHPEVPGLKFGPIGRFLGGERQDEKVQIEFDEFDTGGYYIFRWSDKDSSGRKYDDWVEDLESLIDYFQEAGSAVEWSSD